MVHFGGQTCRTTKGESHTFRNSCLCDSISYLTEGKKLGVWSSQMSEITWQPFVHSEVFHFNSLNSEAIFFEEAVDCNSTSWGISLRWWTHLLQSQDLTQKLQLLLSSLQCDFSHVISSGCGMWQIWTGKTLDFYSCIVTATRMK